MQGTRVVCVPKERSSEIRLGHRGLSLAGLARAVRARVNQSLALASSEFTDKSPAYTDTGPRSYVLAPSCSLLSNRLSPWAHAPCPPCPGSGSLACGLGFS